MDCWPSPVTSRTSFSPAEAASSTTYWMAGLSTTGSMTLGVTFVAGRNLVPRPATGMTALLTVADVAMVKTLTRSSEAPVHGMADRDHALSRAEATQGGQSMP